MALRMEINFGVRTVLKCLGPATTALPSCQARTVSRFYVISSLLPKSLFRTVLYAIICFGITFFSILLTLCFNHNLLKCRRFVF